MSEAAPAIYRCEFCSSTSDDPDGWILSDHPGLTMCSGCLDRLELEDLYRIHFGEAA